MYDDPLLATQPRHTSRVLWIGIAILSFGVGPLLLTILASTLGLLSDPNPNPIGLGILAFFAFWPGVITTVVGIVRTAQYRANRR